MEYYYINKNLAEMNTYSDMYYHKKIMLNKEARHKRVHTIFFGLHEFFEQRKQTNKWEQKSEFFWPYVE